MAQAVVLFSKLLWSENRFPADPDVTWTQEMLILPDSWMHATCGLTEYTIAAGGWLGVPEQQELGREADVMDTKII